MQKRRDYPIREVPFADLKVTSRTDAEDDDEGRWITTENNHKVHLNEEGEPDKGNPHVIEAMTGKKPKTTPKDVFENKLKSILSSSE